MGLHAAHFTVSHDREKLKGELVEDRMNPTKYTLHKRNDRFDFIHGKFAQLTVRSKQIFVHREIASIWIQVTNLP